MPVAIVGMTSSLADQGGANISGKECAVIAATPETRSSARLLPSGPS